MAATVQNMAPYVNSRGEEFYQLFQHYPILRYFYTSFESNFDAASSCKFASDHHILPFVICAGYLAFCFGGQYLMKSRQRFDLRYPLAYWNLLLSLFSFLGMIRTVPHLVYNLTHLSFEDTICSPPGETYASGANGFWVALFIFSKIPELLDTFFIVMRKRPLIFLHWYHHVTVLLFCWHSYATESSSGLYFVAMNYTVHAIMYGYYFLMAMKIKPPIPAWTITVAQILQMFVGTFICLASYFLMRSGRTCAVKMDNVLAGGAMYLSYFILFMHFALQRYVFKSKNVKFE
jgi:elongation of very long chain fatty acids protein 6